MEKRKQRCPFALENTAKQTQYCSTTSVMDTIEEQPLGKQATLICDVFLHKVKVQIKNIIH